MNSQLTPRLTLLAVSLAWLIQPGTAQELLVNGSFEDFTGASGGPNNWTNVPGWANLQNGDPLTIRNSVWLPDTGAYSCSLSGQSTPDQPAQTIATVPGQVYRLRLAWKPRPVGGSSPALHHINVMWDGNLVFTDSLPPPAADPSYEQVSLLVTASTTSTQLSFFDDLQGTGPGSVIDSVSLIEDTFGSESCFDPNFGAALGGGNAVVFGAQPIGFAFPFGGATYTDVHVTTDGVVYLSNGGTPAPGPSLVISPANMIAGSPMLAVWGQDLNVLTVNGASCYISQAGSRTVITWDKVVERGNSTEVVVQCQLYPSGDFTYFYNGDANRIRTSGQCLVGFSPGAGAANPGPSDLSAGPSVGTTAHERFNRNTAPFDIGGGQAVSFRLNGAGYDVSTTVCGSSHTAYGSGCTEGQASFYEHFQGAFDLQNTQLTMIPNASGGYDVTPTSPPGSLGNLGNLVQLGDDDIITRNLAFTFDYPGGSTSSVTISSNGTLYLGNNGTIEWTPSVSDLLNDSFATICAGWQDLDPTNVFSGGVFFRSLPGEAIITWWELALYQGGAATSTMQLRLIDNGTSDRVELRIYNFENAGAIVGFSPGHGAQNPGASDLSQGVSTIAENLNLSLSAAPSPVLGEPVTYTVDNIRANQSISTLWFSFVQTTPVPLSTLGFDSPGCDAHIDLLQAVPFGPLLLANPSDSYQVTIPSDPSWIGALFYLQASSLAPVSTPSGIIVSNGLRSRLDTF